MTYPYIASLSLLWASVGTFCGVVPGGPGAPVGEVPTPGMTWLPRPADPGLPEEGVWLLVGVAAAPVQTLFLSRHHTLISCSKA